MNNLNFFRETACLSKKEIASLMNVTVYTYMGYEEERMIMSEETKMLISMIFNIDIEQISCCKTNISNTTINKLNVLSQMSQDERYRNLIYNLTGKKQDKIGYKQIDLIIKNLKKCQKIEL